MYGREERAARRRELGRAAGPSAKFYRAGAPAAEAAAAAEAEALARSRTSSQRMVDERAAHFLARCVGAEPFGKDVRPALELPPLGWLPVL